MRKAFATIIPVLLLAVFAAQFSACEKYVLPSLEIAPDTLRFGATADSQAVVVTTNVITTLYPENDDYWVHARPAWLEQNATVESRTAVIPVKSEAILRNLVVIQEGTTAPDPEPEPETE